MKKIFFVILLLGFLVGNANSTEVMYALSSGEVLEITDAQLNSIPNEYHGVLIDPPLPDGVAFADPDNRLRVLGYAKINDSGTVRNATQEEIDGFAAYEAADRNIKEAALAKKLFETDAKFRRAFIAIIRGVVREDNEGREWKRAFMDAVAASTSLGDFQSRVAALDYPVDRELQDAIDYIKDQISADD